MLIFWKKRLAILANPKTGSTAIESALGSLAHVAIGRPAEMKHMSASHFDTHLAPFLEKAAGGRFTTVALMREPTDWLGSWYRYRLRDDIPKPERSAAGLTFDEAAQDYVSPKPSAKMAVGSQAKFLGWSEGKTAVDRIFCYENMAKFLEFMEDRLDCEIILPQLNVSPKSALTLQPETRRRLQEKLAPDYELYQRIS